LGAGVGAAAIVGEVVAIVLRLFAVTAPASISIKRDCGAEDLPIALTTSLLLDTLWIGVGVTVLGEVAREMIFRKSGAVSKTTVIAVVSFVGAGH
jgi:hypothetical protein